MKIITILVLTLYALVLYSMWDQHVRNVPLFPDWFQEIERSE